jgi:hypothetical protein
MVIWDALHASMVAAGVLLLVAGHKANPDDVCDLRVER